MLRQSHQVVFGTPDFSSGRDFSGLDSVESFCCEDPESRSFNGREVIRDLPTMNSAPKEQDFRAQV